MIKLVMGFHDSLLSLLGFVIGISLGLVIGFFMFIYSEPRRHFYEENAVGFDSISLADLIPKLPLWVMNPDYERVDWLNKLIHSVWPYFDKAVCGIVKSSEEVIFADHVGMYKIKSIRFEHLSLGTHPPKLHGLKPIDSNEDELVLDLALRWAGDSNITLGIEFSHFKLNVGVRKKNYCPHKNHAILTQIFEETNEIMHRIFGRPDSRHSCLSSNEGGFKALSPSVSLFFERLRFINGEDLQPKIDFGLRVLRGDIMSIPGLYRYMQDIVRKQIANLYLWPQTYELGILDSSIGAAKKPMGILHAKIVRARKLLNKDIFSTSDPYVKLSLSGENLPSKRTSVKMNNLNPIWNEEFKLSVKEPETQVLLLKLYDWEKIGAHDYLGMQEVHLNELVPYEKKELELNLLHSMDPCDPHNKKYRGQILLHLTFVPFLEDSVRFSGSLSHHVRDHSVSNYSHEGHGPTSLCGTGLLLVTVVSAKDVQGRHRHSNPYVKVLFRGEQKRTKMISKTRNPYWHEEFQFIVDDAPANDRVHVEVMSRRRKLGFTLKESLGFVDVNLGDVVCNGRMNEKYHLINSRDGIIHLDIRWKVI